MGFATGRGAVNFGDCQARYNRPCSCQLGPVSHCCTHGHAAAGGWRALQNWSGILVLISARTARNKQ